MPSNYSKSAYHITDRVPYKEIYIFTIITITTHLILILRMTIINLLDERSFNIGFVIFAHMARHASTTRRCSVNARVQMT
jgi:hypothetical protein